MSKNREATCAAIMKTLRNAADFTDSPSVC